MECICQDIFAKMGQLLAQIAQMANSNQSYDGNSFQPNFESGDQLSAASASRFDVSSLNLQ